MKTTQRAMVFFLILMTMPSNGAPRSSGGSHSSGSHSRGSYSSSAPVHVSGYTRKDGTVVQPYERARPGQGPSSGGVSGSASSTAPVHVSGYTRKDGVYVAPHYRSAPDGVRANNWTTTPNVNPYTGVQGTRPLTPVGAPRTQAVRLAEQEHSEAQLKAISREAKAGSHSAATSVSSGGATGTHFTVSGLGTRDSHGRIRRSEAAKREFMRDTGYPHGRPGYVVDHIVALKRGGADSPSNMQWQTVEEAKRKDKWE